MSVAALARAKVNLSLHVVGRRADGYHMLDSLVVFPNVGDIVEVEPARGLSLALGGPFGLELDSGPGNLAFDAADRLRSSLGGRSAGAAIRLEKRLPIASGVGGGSSDAATTLKLLNALWTPGLSPNALAALGLGLGADVPVCLRAPEPTWMRGVGDALTPAPALPRCWMALLNPGVAVETGAVFRRLTTPDNAPPLAAPAQWDDLDALVAWLRATRNDLEPPAMASQPAIGDARAAMAAQRGCLFARMSGSGATIFGLFAREDDALAAAAALRSAEPRWWVAAAPL